MKSLQAKIECSIKTHLNISYCIVTNLFCLSMRSCSSSWILSLCCLCFLLTYAFCNNLISLRTSTKCHHHFIHLIDQAMFDLLSGVPKHILTVMHLIVQYCLTEFKNIYF